MAEIKTKIKSLEETDISNENPSDILVILPSHTHNDILRYVMKDQGAEDTYNLVKLIWEEDFNG